MRRKKRIDRSADFLLFANCVRAGKRFISKFDPLPRSAPVGARERTIQLNAQLGFFSFTVFLPSPNKTQSSDALIRERIIIMTEAFFLEGNI